MRISDWSSDVCSSDLLQRKNRKRKKRLASMLAEFQASTAALPDGAVVLGDHGAISWFNTAAVQLLGLRAPQDLGIRIPNLIRYPGFTEFFERGDRKSTRLNSSH